MHSFGRGDSELENVSSMFSLVMSLTNSLIKNWASCGVSVMSSKDSEFGETMTIPHFCFTPVVGTVRCNEVYCQEREETKRCGATKA